MQHLNNFSPVHFHPHLSGVYDGKIRVKATELHTAGLVHNFSYLDDQIRSEVPCVCVGAGSTEWIGQFAGRKISIGWDWFIDADCRVKLFKAVAPRSNICVIDHCGYDINDPQGSDLLFNFLNEPFWHSPVHEICAQSGVKTRQNLAI
jgi:hypothetical protein